jgi:cell division protein FtsB
MIVGYFAYHAVEGDRGLIAWVKLRQQAQETHALQAEVSAKRDHWRHRVAGLRPESLDRDLLEERARVLLGYGNPEDVVVLRPRREHSKP